MSYDAPSLTSSKASFDNNDGSAEIHRLKRAYLKIDLVVVPIATLLCKHISMLDP
jgi:hypothetical protein